jgi:hypothetical protein
MTATRNYTWLTSIHVMFVLLPDNTDADEALNDIYSDDLHLLDDLFTFNPGDVVPDVLTIKSLRL